MPVNRREFLTVSAAGAAMLKQQMIVLGATPQATPENIQAVIDASKVGAPVTPLIFGGYMEPATTRVWAEMLTDRKFALAITAEKPAPRTGFFRFFRVERWEPVGPAASVEMDTERPFVGAHSPRISLAGASPRGIEQSGVRLARGKSYTGRIYLKGDRSAKVEVRLVWGAGPGDAQTIRIPALSGEYRKFPLKFTAKADATDAKFEITATGSGAFHVGTVSLMPADNLHGFDAGMVKLYREAGFKMAKWPGGNFVSGYDWYDGIGDRDKRPPRPQAMWGNRFESNDVGVDDFVQFCRLLDAEPYVAINSGFGEARVAAEEVEYCNGSTSTRLGRMRAENGYREPHNVRLWCIGNEMYGFWQFGKMSLNQYWVKHNEIVEAMKKVDPAIKVTSSGASICEKSWCYAENYYLAARPDMWRPPLVDKLPFKFGGPHDYDGWMLAKCTDNIDHLSEHTYCYPELAFDGETQKWNQPNDPLPHKARRMANRVGEAFDAWRKYVEKMPSLEQKNIKFIFDEWGARYRSLKGGFERPSGMLTPLASAIFLHELFRHSDMVAASCPTGGLYQVLINSTGEAVGFSAEGLVMKLFGNHLANALPVEVTGNSPQQPVSGTPFVDIPLSPCGSPTYPLDIVAALSGDRKKFILSVVNPTETGQKFGGQISGVEPGGPGKLWQIAPPSLNSANVPGKDPEVEIVETSVPKLPDTIELPPYSISVYEFPV